MPVSTIPLASAVSGTLPDGSAPSGSVIQVVSSVFSSNFSTSSSSDQDTGLNASITPSSTSSRILIVVSTMLRAAGSGGNCYVYQKLWRGAVTSGTRLLDGYPIIGAQNTDVRGVGNFTFVDSPNTTSSVTYRISINSGFATSVSLNDSTNPSTITLLEIAG